MCMLIISHLKSAVKEMQQNEKLMVLSCIGDSSLHAAGVYNPILVKLPG